MADTIVPRLLAAGADLSRVHALIEVEEMGSDGTIRMVPPSLPRDIPLLRKLVRRHRVKLVIIDVFMAYLSGKVDANKDQEVRAVLHQLTALAEAMGCAFVLIRHLNKSGGSNAVYRGGGSIGIIGASRAAFVVARDPIDTDRRILAVSKFNVGKEPPARAYRLVDDSQHGQPRVEWEPDPVDYTASALLSATPDNDSGATNEATAWLSQLLADGALPASEVYQEAQAAGFSKDQIKRVKQRAGVATKKNGMTGGWVWTMTEERTKSAKGVAAEEPRSSHASPRTVLPSEERPEPRKVRVPRPRIDAQVGR